MLDDDFPSPLGSIQKNDYELFKYQIEHGWYSKKFLYREELLYSAIAYNRDIKFIRLLLKHNFPVNQITSQPHDILKNKKDRPIDVTLLKKRYDILYELILAGSSWWHTCYVGLAGPFIFLDACHEKNYRGQTAYPTAKKAIIDKAYQDGLDNIEFKIPNVAFQYDHGELFAEALRYSQAAMHTGQKILEQKRLCDRERLISYSYNTLSETPLPFHLFPARHEDNDETELLLGKNKPTLRQRIFG